MAGGFTRIYSRVATRLSTANRRGPSLWKAENGDVDAHKIRTQSSAAGKGQGRPGLPGDCHDLCRRQCDCVLDLAADLVSIFSQAVQYYIIDPKRCLKRIRLLRVRNAVLRTWLGANGMSVSGHKPGIVFFHWLPSETRRCPLCEPKT
jgi:hypothetical protein